MAFQAQDHIDKLLIRKYSKEQVENHAVISKDVIAMVDPEKMMDTITDYANMSRNMLAMNQRLNDFCSKLRAQNTQYKKAASLR